MFYRRFIPGKITYLLLLREKVTPSLSPSCSSSVQLSSRPELTGGPVQVDLLEECPDAHPKLIVLRPESTSVFPFSEMQVETLFPFSVSLTRLRRVSSWSSSLQSLTVSCSLRFTSSSSCSGQKIIKLPQSLWAIRIGFKKVHPN